MIENRLRLFPLDEIVVTDRDRRKVSDEHIQNLASSIQAHGLYHAVLVEEGTNRLIVGGCRLAAFKLLATSNDLFSKIPGRYAKNVSEQEIKAIELEENLKRQDLDWKDEAEAFVAYHDLNTEVNPDWTLNQTAMSLGFPESIVRRALIVGRALREENPLAHNSNSIYSAWAALNRKLSRAIVADIERSDDLAIDVIDEVAKPATPRADPAVAPATDSIICANFEEWVSTYRGPRFNFIHCDFPYGIGWDTARKGNSNATTRSGMYDDSAETYIKLCTVLRENWSNIMAPSSHIMFWLSGRHEIHTWTREFFSHITWDEFPLIWLKSDNVGMIPDPERGGRRNYETALFGYTGDRMIVSPVSMAYPAPTGRASRIHASEKPEPVLRHFFRMIVDSSVRMLDPTCGSGTAIRAAESLKAEYVLGIELDPANADAAQVELTKSRRLASISREVEL